MLDKRGPDGQTLRETFKTVEVMTGRKPPGSINPVQFPGLLRNLWRHFCRLSASREMDQFGPKPITEIGIQAYAANRRIQFAWWELDAIFSLDCVALKSTAPKTVGDSHGG